MHQPKVSVIIPVYNKDKFLSECLDCVVNQDLSDIEIICVDDGSTDDSPIILRKYAAKDSRIRILTQTNSGSGPARNNGILSANGEFVIFLDADDYYPEKVTLNRLYYAAKNNDSLICGGSFSSVFPDGSIITEYKAPRCWGYTFSKDCKMNYADYQFDYGYHRFLYNRQFLIENNLFFPPYLRYQDPPFFVRAMIAAGSFFAIHDVTYRYRRDGIDRGIATDIRKIRDSIYGYTDVLKMAKDHQLWRLYKVSIERCYNENWHVLCAAEHIQHTEIQEALKKLDEAIDLTLLDKNISALYKLYYIRERETHINIPSDPSISSFRKIKKAMKCLKERGIKYTLRQIKSCLKQRT